jgi:hypothetical protein
VFNDGSAEVSGAPDIGAVTVKQDGSVLTVEAEVGDMLQLGDRGTALFMLNTDGDAETGDIYGADYLLFWDSKTFASDVERWNGKKYVAARKAADPSRSVVSGHSVGFEFNLANFGWPRRIELSVAISRGDPSAGVVDFAPNKGAWSFAIHPAMDTLDLTFGQEQPKAGAAFGVKRGTLALTDGHALTPTVFSCTARIGGIRLAGIGRPGACRWEIPENAAGKQFLLDVTVSYAGETADFGTWKFRVGS